MSFFQSFTETLIHSLWQTPLLLLVYTLITASAQRMHPLQKRNALYIIIAAQILFSAVSFYLFYTDTAFNKVSIAQLISSGEQGWMAQYAAIVFYAWLAVAFIKSGMILKQWITFKKQLAANFIHPAADLKVFTELKSYHLGIKRKVSLWLSTKIATPITYGFLKPVILLPFSLMNDISQEEAETIILHELAHIKSRDYLLNWLLVAAEIIYFFNPFIKIISKKIKLEREKNCDVQVINFEYSPIAYAQVLLRIAKRKQELMSFQLAAAKRSSQLLQRVRFFSEEENFNFRKLRSGIVAFPAMMIILVSAFFFLPKKEKVLSPAQIPVAIDIKKSELMPVINTTSVETGENTITHAAAIVPPDRTYGEQDVELESFNAAAEPAMAFHVAFKEQADSVKEFIYNIETPQGKITQNFKLTLVNGQWIFEPLWMLTETRPDSLRILISKDSIQ